MADFCFNGLTDVTPTDRAVTLAASRGLGWMLDTSQANEFALAHWLTAGASGALTFVRVFDGAGNVREDSADDVFASITTMQWTGPAKGWNADAPMDYASRTKVSPSCPSDAGRRASARLGFAAFAASALRAAGRNFVRRVLRQIQARRTAPSRAFRFDIALRGRRQSVFENRKEGL